MAAHGIDNTAVCSKCLAVFANTRDLYRHEKNNSCYARQNRTAQRSYIRKSENVCISLPGDVLKNLDRIAGSRNVPRSTIILNAILIVYGDRGKKTIRKSRKVKIGGFGPGDIFYDIIVKEVRGY